MSALAQKSRAESRCARKQAHRSGRCLHYRRHSGHASRASAHRARVDLQVGWFHREGAPRHAAQAARDLRLDARSVEAANLGRVVPQLEIYDERGVFIARPDATLPDVRITVEYESDQEHTDEMSLARDNVRRNRLMAQGWLVVAARKFDIRNGGDEIVAAVRALAELASRNKA